MQEEFRVPFYSNANAMSAPPDEFIQEVTIERLDLWGNMKDGFDCNGVAGTTSFDVPALTEHQYRVIERKTREYMSGRHYAKSENKDGYLPSRGFEFDWSNERFCDVNYQGVTFATIRIEEKRQTKPCWEVSSMWRPNPTGLSITHSQCFFATKRDALDQVRQLKLGGNANYIQVSKPNGDVLMEFSRKEDKGQSRYVWEATKHSD